MDRRYMVVRADNGMFVTARQDPALLQVTASWQQGDAAPVLGYSGKDALALPALHSLTDTSPVRVWKDDVTALDCGVAAARWFSDVLQKEVRLVAMPPRGRVRDKEAPMPVSFADGYPFLVANKASLDFLNARIGEDLPMRRFRPNLVIDGAEAFVEDGWKKIQIGSVTFEVSSACARCVLTTRDPETGEQHARNEPLTSMRPFRRGSDGQLYFGMNLRPLGTGQVAVGDQVTVLETGPAELP